MQAVATPKASAVRTTVRTRQPLRVQASARPQQAAPKKAPVVAAVLALAATVLINAAPAAAADVKSVVCASNPTAKICLKGSAKN
ncbi:expressed protein [Chlorella variabilis]|uniref:Expressed protein n=1 Tax=Chlorella variabilis TaxID=554065 RepID=E1ZDF1_CHLVA|nr:expressed protein [Chlorella variabilis]EFN56214.1 expressed protein [Chlorella variabilis]|eukprot:XP_005848316.1 expressed protein [Chlorella variabilis]